MKCASTQCRNRAAKCRRKCHRCRKCEWRERHPFRSQFARLRDKARERGILFALSFADFFLFAIETEYVTRTGNERGSITVDRIINNRGYELGNIQPLTREENAIKRSKAEEIAMIFGLKWKRRYGN